MRSTVKQLTESQFAGGVANLDQDSWITGVQAQATRYLCM